MVCDATDGRQVRKSRAPSDAGIAWTLVGADHVARRGAARALRTAAEAAADDVGEGLSHDGFAHLALAHLAVGEDDGHLDRYRVEGVDDVRFARQVDAGLEDAERRERYLEGEKPRPADDGKADGALVSDMRHM